jgi:hypothetical protein
MPPRYLARPFRPSQMRAAGTKLANVRMADNWSGGDEWGGIMKDLLTHPVFSNSAHSRPMPTGAYEAQRNRLCELRQNPQFAEWWRLTEALGAPDLLLVLANEVAAAMPDVDTTALVKSLTRAVDGIAAPGDDRWVNPLFPLAPADEVRPLPLVLPAHLDTAAAGAD